MAMLIFLSPSKTIARIPVDNVPQTTMPLFSARASDINKVLRGLSLNDLKSFLSVSLPLARLNFERNLNWSLPFTSSNSYPAIASFKGDVYEGLNVADFNSNDFLFAQNHLRILSGFYGILRPLDLMQPYRLEMGSGLEVGDAKDLYEYWSKIITDFVNSEISSLKIDTLLNLASQEYFKVLNTKHLNAKIITPEFKEQKGNQFKTIAIHAKRARGLMSRFIIKNRIVEVEQIKHFNVEGYFYNPDLSNDRSIVFVR